MGGVKAPAPCARPQAARLTRSEQGETAPALLPDGSLDYEDELLARLDWVIASVHTSFSMGAKEMTDRMIRAIEHPLVDAIGHPTGRKIETRPPYELDVERVIEAAARTGTMIEINSAPDRRLSMGELGTVAVVSRRPAVAPSRSVTPTAMDASSRIAT